MPTVSAFECFPVERPEWGRVINARSRGKAKVQYWREVTEPWPGIPFTSIRARKVGGPQTSKDFVRNAEYRGFPGLKCGQPVKVGEAKGVIVGHNDSANFDVLFNDDSPKYAGLTLNVHPGEIELV